MCKTVSAQLSTAEVTRHGYVNETSFCLVKQCTGRR